MSWTVGGLAGVTLHHYRKHPVAPLRRGRRTKAW